MNEEQEITQAKKTNKQIISWFEDHGFKMAHKMEAVSRFAKVIEEASKETGLPF